MQHMNMSMNVNANQPLTGNMNQLHQTGPHPSYIALNTNHNAPPHQYNFHPNLAVNHREANKPPYILANANQPPSLHGPTPVTVPATATATATATANPTTNISYVPATNLQSLPSIPSLPSLNTIPSLPSLSATLHTIPSLPAIPSYPAPTPTTTIPTATYYHHHSAVNSTNIIHNIPPPNMHNIPSLTSLPHIPSLPSIPSMPSLGNSMRSIPSIPSFPSLHSIPDQSQNDLDNMHRSPTIRSDLSSLASDQGIAGSDHRSNVGSDPNDPILNSTEFTPRAVTPLPITPMDASPKPMEDSSHGNNGVCPPQFTNESVLEMIDAATVRTMQITDNLATNQNINDLNAQIHAIKAHMNMSINTMSGMNAMNNANTQMMAQQMNNITLEETEGGNEEKKEEDEDEEEGNCKRPHQSQHPQHHQHTTHPHHNKPVNKKEVRSNHDAEGKNPWFNDEIASIVKLHRKTIRKYHRSKTKKKELKLQCKELEKKKRKLIKAAKQKYTQQLLAQQNQNEDENEHTALPQTRISNVRELDEPLIEIPQFFKTATKQIYQICDTYL